jgi:hypothetical protein
VFLLAPSPVRPQERARSPQPSLSANAQPTAGDTQRTRIRVHAKTVVRFGFDIPNLTTNHQFEGQQNTFHVMYEYAGVLKGGGFDPKGRSVSAETFPYFQTIRDDIIQYIHDYPDKNNFYELFGIDICDHVIERYPQIREVTLKIDTPAYQGVAVDRTETVVVTRQAKAPKTIHPSH